MNLCDKYGRQFITKTELNRHMFTYTVCLIGRLRNLFPYLSTSGAQDERAYWLSYPGCERRFNDGSTRKNHALKHQVRLGFNLILPRSFFLRKCPGKGVFLPLLSEVLHLKRAVEAPRQRGRLQGAPVIVVHSNGWAIKRNFSRNKASGTTKPLARPLAAVVRAQ